MADNDFLFQDWSDDAPCDPGPDTRPWSVLSILGSLEQACRNQHPAWCLDNALLSIENKRPMPGHSPLQLDEEDRDEILQCLTRARVLMPHFIPEYPAQKFAIGLDAAMTQVILWSETQEERALRHPDTKSDARDLARVLRNDMHSICLAQRVQERWQKRHADTVSELIQPVRRTGPR